MNRIIVYLLIALTVGSLFLLPTTTRGSITTSATLTSSGYIQSNPTSTPTPTTTPTPTHVGLLHVVGTHLKDANGNAVVLRGVHWAYGFSSGDPDINTQYPYMKQWGINAVRLVIHPQDPRYDSGFLARLDSAVNGALANGIYVVLDAWADANGNNIQTFTTSTWNDYNSWWAFLAQRYSGKGIIYDTMNEPFNWDYADHQSRMMNLINIIRAYDSTSIIMFEASDWDFSFQYYAPITGTNLIFSPHKYADETNGANDQNGIRASLNSGFREGWMLSQGYCVVFGEYGGDQSNGGIYGGPQSAFSCTWLQNFLTVCDANGYSGYCAFDWGLIMMPLVTDWYGTPNSCGTVVRNHYLGFG